jgi:pSer/pThr/pTyr-binding forkhead associated (FHA) protein
MALTLVVRGDPPEHSRSISLDSPRIVIGRAADSDLVLPDPSVSLRHATLRQRGQDYIVVDEGSTNGTFVGPVRLAPATSRLIRSGDLIRVGRVWLEVRASATPVTDNPMLATRELALGMVEDALCRGGESHLPRIRVEDGPDRGLELELLENHRPYVVGRSKSVDLALTEPDASRRHLELRRRGAEVVVRDLGSKNGTTLGDQPLPPDLDHTWPPKSLLCIGRDRLSLTDPVADAFREVLAQADEHLPLHTEIPIPGQGSNGRASVDLVEVDDLPKLPSARAGKRFGPRHGGALDLLVALLALAVIAVSAGALWFLFSGKTVAP